MERITSNSILNPDENLAGAIEEFAYYSDEPTARMRARCLFGSFRR